jgi:RNA 2',3'-cyclic 3'-phosphodiesterase
VPVPSDAARQLDARIGAVRSQLAPDADATVRWVRADSFHLTLRFLGATPVDDVLSVARAARETVERVAPFDIELGRLEALGRGRSPALVADVDTGAGDVASLAQVLSDSLGRVGWAREARPFRPHVTVGRASRRRGAAATVQLLAQRVTAAGIGWHVTSVVVFESRLGSGPPVYIARAVADLRA